MRSLALGSVTVSALVLAFSLGGCANEGGAAHVSSSGRLIALSDGDLVTTAFHDGVLFSGGATREPDALTVIALPLPEPEAGAGAAVAQAELSNSVLGPPRALVITPGGDSVLVLCTRGDAGDPPYAGKTMKDLGRESTLALVDIAEAPSVAPRVIATMPLGPGAASVSLHPDGDLAAVVLSTPTSRELAFIRVDTRHGLWSLSRLPLSDLSESGTETPATVAFSPAGDALALTVLGSDQVLFYELIREGAVLGVKQWGQAVPVGNFPMTADWTPDGRFFIVSSLAWGEPTKHDIESGEAGTLTCIRVSESRGADARHEPASSVTVGVGPEGLAIAPDGSAVVTGNMRLITLPEGDPRRTPMCSLSLVALDRDSGILRVIGEYDCGVAPEGLAFDTSGEALFVTDFDAGVVQQWSYRGGRSPRLEYTRVRVGVERGVHALAVAP